MGGRPKRKAMENTQNNAKRAKGECPSLEKFGLRWIHACGEAASNVPNLFVLTNPDNTKRTDKKIMAFDIDWCIIKPKSGGKWPQGPNDWCWLFDGDVIPEKLRSLHKEGFRLLFISNQGGFEKNRVKPSDITTKCELIIAALDVPVEVILVSGQGHFRKPDTGAWDYFVKEWNSGIDFDPSVSCFIGDAAGRPALGERKKDFSCSDRMFAANLGLQFHTPEEFFLGEPACTFSWGGKNPEDLFNTIASNSYDPKGYHSESQELVIMVGPPACGKSSFSEKFFVPHGYVRVNRDTLKTPANCQRVAESSLKEKKSVVVDNTNPGQKDRAPYLALAKKYGVPVRCFTMTTDWDLALHLNLFRQSKTESEVRRIPMVAYNMYKKNAEEPILSEGFSDIKKIPFVLDDANFSEKEKKLLRNWTSLGH